MNYEQLDRQAYAHYCLLCAENGLDPLPFEQYLFLISDEEVRA
ncbi:hypothetical protein ACLBWT_19000 [Paenibacillus sp. D51F]